MILEPLNLDYIIKNEVLVITTAAKANEHFEIRVYDVSRLKGVTPMNWTRSFAARSPRRPGHQSHRPSNLGAGASARGHPVGRLVPVCRRRRWWWTPPVA